jgi:hypothetical protein
MTGNRSARGSAGKALRRIEGIGSGADAGFRSRFGVGWSVGMGKGKGVVERKRGEKEEKNSDL